MVVYHSVEGRVIRIPVEISYRSELAGITIELAQLFD